MSRYIEEVYETDECYIKIKLDVERIKLLKVCKFKCAPSYTLSALTLKCCTLQLEISINSVADSLLRATKLKLKPNVSARNDAIPN